MEERSIESGSAIGIFVVAAWPNNSRITYHSNPLPIRSSIYLNKKSIMRTNITMQKHTKNGLINACNINKCIFFMPYKLCKNQFLRKPVQRYYFLCSYNTLQVLN